MRRSSILLVVLLAMLWQSLALARPGSTVNLLADLEHAALHWAGEDHHHHDDGSYHQDDSQASTLHVLGDPVSVATVLLPAISQQPPPSTGARPGGLLDTAVPAPFLDGLLRPPRRPA